MTTSIILVCIDAVPMYWLQRSLLYFEQYGSKRLNLGGNKDNLQLQLAMTDMEYTWPTTSQPIPVAARSKVKVCRRFMLGSRVHIPLRVWMLVLGVYCALCRQPPLRRAGHSFRRVPPRVCGVCLSVILKSSTIRRSMPRLGCCARHRYFTIITDNFKSSFTSTASTHPFKTRNLTAYIMETK